jgi:TonB family protein
MTLAVLLLKVSALFALVLLCLPLMRRSLFATTAAIRHLVCAVALMGALAFLLTLAFEPKAIPVKVPVVFFSTVTTVAKADHRGFPTINTLLALWALGAGMLLLRLVLGYRRISLVVRRAERTEDHAPIFLADVSVPLICGLFRPAILLPRDSVTWPQNQRLAAVSHEVAHLRRKDLWTSLIANIACAVYWFHPLGWAVARQLRKEQEDACDDAVLAGGFEPATYAEALMATAQHLTSPSLIGCHMLTGRSLRNRIERLLDLNLPRTASGISRMRVAVLSIAALALLGLVYAQPPAIRSTSRIPELGKVYKMGPGLHAPRVLRKIDPQYTEEARQARISGAVLLSVVVGADGMAHNIGVVTTPDAGLSLKAVEAVQQWKFQPATKDGEPVAVKAQIEVHFRLL